MKTARNLFVCTLLLAIAGPGFAQESGVSPIYIPGTKLGIKKTVKKVDSTKSVTELTSTRVNSRLAKSKSIPTPIKTATSSRIAPSPGLVSHCDNRSSCNGSCDQGCSGCQTGCTCDPCTSLCGCNCGYDECEDDCGCGLFRRGRIGRSFFGRVRDRMPIKFSVNRGGRGGAVAGGCDGCDSGCESCAPQNCEYIGGRFARFLPVSVRMCSNHCCKYTSIFGGYVDLEDYDGIGPAGTRLIEFNDGWQMGLKRGRVFENGVRLESEFTFRHNTNDTYSAGNFVGMNFVPVATFDAIDSIYQLSSMTNVLFDLQNLSRGGITPYVGLGMGGVYADGDIITPAIGGNDFIEDYAWAYQLILGANRSIRENVIGFVEYKYFGTSGVDVENAMGVVGEFDLQSNNVIFGLSFIRPNGCCN